MKSFKTSLLLVALLAAGAAQAQVSVKDAWVRATVPQQKATGAFMQLQSATPARLVGVSTPLTPVAEVHEMAMVDNVMKMRQVPGIEVPPGKTVELKPGGYHVMLMDLKQQVKAGETVPLTLIFEGADGKRQNVQVQAPVRSLAGDAAPAHDHMGHGGDGKPAAGHKH